LWNAGTVNAGQGFATYGAAVNSGFFNTGTDIPRFGNSAGDSGIGAISGIGSFLVTGVRALAAESDPLPRPRVVLIATPVRRSDPMTVKTVSPLRRGLYGLVAAGLLSATAPAMIASPLANADPQCDQTVGQSIDSYLTRHPDVKAQLQARSQAEGGGGNVIDYLNRHPDVRQHLIDLSQQCAP
jgi:hypothetical protein